MQRLHYRLVALITLIVYVASVGCSAFHDVERKTHTPAEFRVLDEKKPGKLARDSPYLKVHMLDGNLYILTQWKSDGAGAVVTGEGTLYRPDRSPINSGTFTVGVDSVALFETNVVKNSPLVGLVVVAGIFTAALAIYCATHEKACFGSCPTFYVAGVDSLRPRAEGFSSSIAPSLEASDIDDLSLHASGGSIDIEMRNEAYETHVVRRVDLLAAPRADGHRVLVDDERRCWDTHGLVSPAAARAPEGDCFDLIATADGRERFSETDSTDLRASEFVEVDFNGAAAGQYGIVVDCRQTLLTTYLLYQTLAYMGSEAGHWLAELERGNVAVSPGFVTDYLGCIDVQVADSTGRFVDAGSICEYGPIASDTHFIPLRGQRNGVSKVRLVMTRGNWRIDRVALARIEGEVTPVQVRPSVVWRDGRADEQALGALLDSARVLVTLPGDAYTLHYELPRDADYDLFLDAQGYYLEWIREEWLREENPAALAQMFLSTGDAMKRLAPEFKRVEGTMEALFWSSRYERR